MKAQTSKPRLNHPHSFRAALSTIAIPYLLTAGALCIAQSSPPTPPVPVLRVTSELVLVDVVVTSQGNAVHGLEPKRFHLFEDGHEQRITSFDEHRLATAALTPPKPLPPHTYSNTPLVADRTVANVLLLDEQNTPIESRPYVRQQLLDYLRKAHPGPSFAVFSFNSRLQLLQGFTTDLTLIARAVQNAFATQPAGVEADHRTTDAYTDLVDHMSKVAPGGAHAAAEAAQHNAQVNATHTAFRAQSTAEITLQLARYLAGVPGRKNLIWFSGALPLDSDPGGALSAARVAVYPVDARGLTVSPESQASNQKPKGDRTFLDEAADQNSSMMNLAQQTGGRAFLNTNGFAAAIETAVQDGESYYTLGYHPHATQPERDLHSLKIHLDDLPSAQLAYRRSYTTTRANQPPPPSQMTMQFGAPPATEILFDARILPSTDPLIAGTNIPQGLNGDNAANLKAPIQHTIVDLQVDPHGLTFDDNPDGTHQTTIAFTLAAYDDNGTRLNALHHEIQVRMPHPQYLWTMQHKLAIRMALDLPYGRTALRIGILDRLGGHAGSLEIPLTITPTEQ